MNRDEIKNICPNTFKLVEDHFSRIITIIPKDDLLEFFDDNNLYINVDTEFYKFGVQFNMQVLWKSNDNGDYEGTMSYGDMGEFKNRKMAYQAGIELCFEIMERRLTNKPLYLSIMEQIENPDFTNIGQLLQKYYK